MYRVKYQGVIYQLSEKMQKASLFETLISAGETFFKLKLFKELFIQLNKTGELDLSKHQYSTDEINNLYEGLYYFGYNPGIDSVDKYVYNLELNNAQKQVEEFIIKYPGVITEDCLLKLNLSEEFFQKYYFSNNNQATEIYDNKFIRNSFFKKNFAKCDRYQLENRLYLTEDFVEEFKLFRGCYITDCKHLSEELLERHIDEIELIDNVSEEFTRRHISKLNWHRAIFNKKLSEAFFTEYYSEFRRRNLIDTLCMNTTLPESFFELHKADITSDIAKYNLCLNNNISENFFRRNPELIDWCYIWCNKNISEKFVREYIHRVNWKAVSNSNMSVEFFEEFIKQLYWPDLCYNKYIPEWFFQKHIERLLYWMCLQS